MLLFKIKCTMRPAHQHTAAEVIYERVDNEKPLAGMTNFKSNYIIQSDVGIAKNCLTERELTLLNLLVSQFLDFAELQALEENAIVLIRNGFTSQLRKEYLFIA